MGVRCRLFHRIPPPLKACGLGALEFGLAAATRNTVAGAHGVVAGLRNTELIAVVMIAGLAFLGLAVAGIGHEPGAAGG